MRWLLLIAALIELLSAPAYAHGEQVAYVLYSDAFVLVGWSIFLFIYKASAWHKVTIFVVVLLVVMLSWLLISFWYLTAIKHPLIVSIGFVMFHTMVGLLMLFLSRGTD